MTQQWDLTAVGDVNADLIMAEPERPPTLGQEILVKDAYLTLGGATSLLAAAAARLGLAVRMVGKVGDDYLGRSLIADLQAAGVDTSLIIVDPSLRTGITVSLTWPDDRALVTYDGPIARLTAEEVPPAAFENTRHLHVSSFFLQKALQPGCAGLFRRAREMGLTTSLDTGDDPADRWDSGLVEALGHVDVFFPNRREACQIAQMSDPIAALDRLAARIPTVAVKLGREGAIASIRGQRLRVGAFRVCPVDTTGAGDSFNAGFLRAYLRGLPAEECLLWGAAAGALSTTWLGGQSAQMTAAAVERLIASERGRVSVAHLQGP